uniref:Xylanolytic transcriptional activator regulatory domain-containing protein n=1 Tax=Kwoniella bestiolae CBS 10118 TaxID=1296100 RepID=A0A1B9FVB8_9TREE|nr:hypothetical protein I302_07059 [Kwoniella bestiolae CBS 10118]OCF22719.1 hypothetical protein I302_07059 [Kwoniella bestiolae CBS 10118]
MISVKTQIGPQPGSRKRHNPPSPLTTSGPERSAQRQRLQSGTPTVNEDHVLAQTDAPTAGPSRASSVPRQRVPFGGVPSRLIDQLLPLYFTHVHNVWPLIYKPTFNPHTTSAPLLLSMLAIASCVTRPGSNTTSPTSHNDEDSVESFPADRLFRMAEKSLRECHNDHRIDLIQSLLLLSLRQTGCGDKQSASMYAGRACSMALNMGLNLMPIPANSNPLGTVGGIDMETRSRVYWNTYVLDKTLSEETGRPFLLTYRKTTTPLPSTEELEEYETWPPPVLSATGHNHRYAHITPRKGYVMSCFAWTCRLGMIVEDILDLDTSYPAPINDWDMEFFGRTPISDVDAVSVRLNKWKEALPRNLDVDTKLNKAPLPHHAVGIAWFHTSRILLHSRLINRAKHQNNASCSPMLATSASNPHMNALSARQICSEAAQSNIDILTCLDRYQLLKVASSDVLHMLSLTALFEAFETTNSEIQSADLAKTNFAQCCKWLRDFSSSWPAASSHRLFFEGLIKGGLKMATTTGKKPAGNLRPECRVPASRSVGHNSTSSSLPQPDSPSTPTTPDGLRSIRRNLSVHEEEQGRNDQLQLLSDTATTLSGFDPSMGVINGSMGMTSSPSALFQLPQIYWNSLNTNTNTAANISNPLWDSMIDFEFGSTNDLDGELASSGNAASARTTNTGTLADTDWQIPFDHETGPSQELMSGNNSNPDTSVQSALMAFMMQAARGGH